MAQKVLNYNDAINKFNSGKILSKNDCSLIVNRIYSSFMERVNAAADISEVVLYTAEDVILWNVLIENAVNVVRKNGRPFSVDEVKDYYAWNFCTSHEAKLAGMESTSTNNLINKFCQRNKLIPGSICAKCFADALMRARGSMKKPYTLNFLLLNFKVLPMEIMPLINRQYERIESFGDSASEIQSENYINLTQAHDVNKSCRFGIWSKNPIAYYGVFDRIGKPGNVSFGISSLMINKENRIPKKYIHYVDFLFTCFDNEAAAAAAGITINCGARHCLSCLRCYHARENKVFEPDNVVHVFELVKKI